MNSSSEQRTIKISRKKSIIAIVVLLVILVIWFFTRTTSFTSSYSPRDIGPITNNYPTAAMMPVPSPYPPYRDTQTSSISDTREFLKTNFGADIKTRDVPAVVTNVKNIIKGADGRIDSISSSDKSGRISFVVAKSKFDDFKIEIEAITNKKLYSETVSSQNLLTQKQNIEEQAKNASTSLADFQKQESDLLIQHNKINDSINSQLLKIGNALIAVRANLANVSSTTDPETVLSWKNQQTSLVSQDAIQRSNLNTEYKDYYNQKQKLDTLIANANKAIVDVAKQDNQFTDNVETVNGTVSVTWVSVWEIINIYSPINPIIIIVVLVLIVLIYLRRKGYLPRIQFV